MFAISTFAETTFEESLSSLLEPIFINATNLFYDIIARYTSGFTPFKGHRFVKRRTFEVPRVSIYSRRF